MECIRVMLVDDHEVIRKGIASLIQKTDGMEVVGEAGDGESAIRMAGQLSPDVMIIDVIMPGLNGIEATRAIHSAFPQIKIVTLSLHSDREYIFGMLEAGALGYLLKEYAFMELFEAVHMVNASKFFICSPLFKTMAQELLHIAASTSEHGFKQFTASEMDVLNQLAGGKQAAEIAAALSMRAHDVELDCQNVVNKWLRLHK